MAVGAGLLAVLGGVVARHMLLVLGGGVAGVVRAVVRTVAQSHGVLGAGGPAGGHLACLGGGVGGGGRLVQQGVFRLKVISLLLLKEVESKFR